MPLEIRELVIKAAVTTRNLDGETLSDVSNDRIERQEQDAIISACVQRVLAILKEKAER